MDLEHLLRGSEHLRYNHSRRGLALEPQIVTCSINYDQFSPRGN